MTIQSGLTPPDFEQSNFQQSSASKQILAGSYWSRVNVRRMLFWMVLVAFAIRAVVGLCIYQDHMNPSLHHWSFGYEEGEVAKSIVQGHGFGNPLFTNTGPTALVPPIYPLILAVDFKIFGIETVAACIAILLFNGLVCALTCIPIFFFTRRTLGQGAGLAAGWAWAGYPYAVYWPVYWIWDTWLATLLFAILLCVVLKIARSSKVSQWIGFGLLSGFAALVNPSVLAVLAFWGLWAVWQLHKQRKRWFAPAVGAVLAVILTISPWIIRDYRVFHKFIPIRDGLALDFRIGNTGDSSQVFQLTAGPWFPWLDTTEWSAYVNMGEVAYFHWKGQQAAAYIKAHPVWYAGMVMRRVIYIWTDFWSFSDRYLSQEPLDPLIVPLLALLSVLAFLGLRRAWKKKGADSAMPYALVLIFFPIVYYLTHGGGWYRCPMDPFIIALASYEVHARSVEFLNRKHAAIIIVAATTLHNP